MDRIEGGTEGYSKMLASAIIKPVCALCSDCFCTCAHWWAFAQSALTPFKVTASWGEHPHDRQCPGNANYYFSLLCCLLYCPLKPSLNTPLLSKVFTPPFIHPFANDTGHRKSAMTPPLFHTIVFACQYSALWATHRNVNVFAVHCNFFYIMESNSSSKIIDTFSGGDYDIDYVLLSFIISSYHEQKGSVIFRSL